MKQKAVVKKQKRSRFAFFADIMSELRKVSWPPKREAIYLTVIVVIVSATAGLVLWGIDQGFYRLINVLLLR